MKTQAECYTAHTQKNLKPHAHRMGPEPMEKDRMLIH